MTKIVPVTFPGMTARAASVAPHSGWLVFMMVLGLGSGLLALAFAVITSRWGRMYGLVSGLLRASRPDSGRFPQQAKQWVYQPHWGVPRPQRSWWTVMIVHHSRRLPTVRRQPWRVIWRIWRHRHVRSVPVRKSSRSA